MSENNGQTFPVEGFIGVGHIEKCTKDSCTCKPSWTMCELNWKLSKLREQIAQEIEDISDHQIIQSIGDLEPTMALIVDVITELAATIARGK